MITFDSKYLERLAIREAQELPEFKGKPLVASLNIDHDKDYPDNASVVVGTALNAGKWEKPDRLDIE